VKAKTDGSPNTIFNFLCPGNSSLSYTLLLYKNGHVNREMAEVCRDRFVMVAFNQKPWVFEANNVTNTMIEFSNEWLDTIPAWSWEILSTFFAINKLTPIFIDCNGTSGLLDQDTGLWNGAVAMVGSLDLFVS
jgi:hypothetical protein